MKKEVVNTIAVKKTLPHGAIKEVARRTNTSIVTVSRVIKGSSKNPNIIKGLKLYMDEFNQSVTDLNNICQ